MNAGGVVDVEVPDEIKKDDEYFSNYPNSVTDETTVAYNLTKSSKVTIKLYNFLDKGLQTLIDKQQVAGQHQFNWNLNSISKITTGVYFLQLKSEGGKQKFIRLSLQIKALGKGFYSADNPC